MFPMPSTSAAHLLHPLAAVQLAMHFTPQTIVATFALLSICAYANPMPVNQARDILVARDEASWCAGYSEKGCGDVCRAAGYPNHICTSKYVNLLNTNKRHDVTDNRSIF